MIETERASRIQQEVREFIRSRVLTQEAELLRRPFRQALPQLHALRAEVQKLGLWAPHLPVAYGGQGLTLSEFAPVSEALGQSPFGHYVFNCQAPDVGNMEILMEHASAEQKERFLGPLVRGEIRSCFAMTEPEHARSNPVPIDTQARRDGTEYVIDGHKWFTSSADGAAFAIVMAVTDPEAAPHRRASLIIVPLGTPGFELVRNLPVMGDAGEDYSSHAEIRFTDCRVPRTNLLGTEGAGFSMAQERLGPGRIHHGMRWIGICERAFDLMCRRAASRELAPGKVLASQQTIQNWIAECRVEIDAARLLILDAARRIDRDGAPATRQQISLIKFFAANVLDKVLDRAIQVHGAYGLTDETPLAWWYRHERGARIYDGPDEVHKSAAARSILKAYGVDTP